MATAALICHIQPPPHPPHLSLMQARERWSIEEDMLYRPGHYWVAQAPDVLEVRKLENRETINGQPFSKGDYMVRIGRYFDKDASDATGLTFEEWQPELVFTTDDVRDPAQQAYLPNMYLHYFATI